MDSREQLLRSFQEDPLKALESMNDRRADVWLYRGIVYSLGLSVLAIVAGVIHITLTTSTGEEPIIPHILTALGSAAIGALAGLLAPSPRRS